MDILNIIIFFIFGTLFGSFVNVLVLRYNTGHSCLTGRSKCMSCGKKLSWYELVPLFSFVFLEGKCLGCGSKISPQYFIVESLTGILFSALFVKVGLTSFLPFYLLVTTVLIAMSVYDFRHKIIPDGMVFTFDAFALIFLFFS
ncbi:MAG: prepilin peptidase, partial [Candidatus Paceibacterota bacterium]